MQATDIIDSATGADLLRRLTLTWLPADKTPGLAPIVAEVHKILEQPVDTGKVVDRGVKHHIPGAAAPLVDGLCTLYLAAERSLRDVTVRQSIGQYFGNLPKLHEVLAAAVADTDPQFVQQWMEASSRAAVRIPSLAADIARVEADLGEVILLLADAGFTGHGSVAGEGGGQDDPFDPTYGGSFSICSIPSGNLFGDILCAVFFVLFVILVIALSA